MSPGHLLQVGSRMAVVYGGGSGKGCVRVATSVGHARVRFEDSMRQVGQGVVSVSSSHRTIHAIPAPASFGNYQCSAVQRGVTANLERKNRLFRVACAQILTMPSTYTHGYRQIGRRAVPGF